MPTMFINGEKVEFSPKEKTVLDVARKADIYIPTLCEHEELEPYGGCRMCLVEIEGVRGLVPACTTGAKDGMVVKTDTEEIGELRKNILQLLLVEHPSACLVCAEWDMCTKYRKQPHKAGEITGCNTCPNRETCELREVVEFVGISELEFQPQYRDISIERDDPFFDRDYNLCILCSRCIRVCEEVRGTAAITFSNRGHDTRVDTAFGVSHLDSGCVFCGACVDVCPTGALYPKMTKWTSTPDSTVVSTCVLCGTGCQVEYDIKWKRIMDNKPGSKDLAPNFKHMCVLGRFCIPPLVNAPDRLKLPVIIEDGEDIPVTWDEVIDRAVSILKESPADKVAFIGSPHMTSESAYMFQKLARVAVGTHSIDFRGSDFPSLVHKELARDQDYDRVSQIDALDEVDWIVSIGGDFVVTHQVVAKAVYKAVKRGTPLIVIDEAGKNLRKWSTEYLRKQPEDLKDFLAKLAEHDEDLPGIDKDQAEKIVKITSEGVGAIIVGSRIMESPNPGPSLRALVRLAGNKGVILPLYPLGNEAGVIRAGNRPDLLPGPTSVTVDDARAVIEKQYGKKLQDGYSLVEMREKAKKGEIDVLYVTDGSVPIDGFENVPNIIYQSPFPSPWYNIAKVVLPSAAFAEEEGTFVNHELRVLKLKQAVAPPGQARHDWAIFADIAKELEAEGFDHKNPSEILDEMSKFPRRIETGGQARRASWKPATKKDNEWYRRYRGYIMPERIRDLARFVEVLPDRAEDEEAESLEELVERVKKERMAKLKEVS